METIDKYSPQGIATALRGVIRNKGLTPREISLKVKKPPDWLDRTLRGDAKTFDVGLLAQICDIVEYPIDNFFGQLKTAELTPTAYELKL